MSGSSKVEKRSVIDGHWTQRPEAPADLIRNAVHVVKIATGEIEEETPPEDRKNPNAKALGAKGGAPLEKAMTPERRAEIAKKAAEKW